MSSSATASPPATTTAPKTLPIPLSMATSCVAGCAAWVFAHPFEVLKNHIVLASHETPLMDSVKKAAKEPFKGLSGGLTRQVVYASCRLGFYGPVRNVIVGSSSTTTEPSMIQRAAAGAISGAAAASLSSPIEVCLVHMTKSQTPLSLPAAARIVYDESGVKGFWRGVGPLCNRAAVVGICQVAMYDHSRSVITKYSKARIAAANGDKSAGLTNNEIVIGASTFTGLFYSFVTMPLELARVKMAVFRAAPGCKTPGMFGVLAHTVKTEGAASIFKSFVPYFGRCTSHTIACFFFLEHLNRSARKAYFGSSH